MTEEKQNNAAKDKRRGVIKTIIDLIFVAFSAGISIFYLYVGNLTEIRPHEIVFPLLISSGISSLSS
jgi:hypothetical protein